MTDWTRGGLTGSLNRWVAKEVREQLRSNSLARRARYSWPLRAARWAFSAGSFWKFLALYFLVDLLMINVEAFWHGLASASIPTFANSAAASELMKNVPGYLIGAQIGLLSVISLALALVTLIAQRDDAATDVQVYYHESLFFEIMASCLALIAVLCAQLFWPLQFLYHLLGGGGQPALFKMSLLVLHLFWFLANLAAMAHFVGITFRFVQRRTREKLRESYTANVIVPMEMTARLRETVYSMAGAEALPVPAEEIHPVCFGLELHEPYAAELSDHFKRPTRIGDVRVRLAHWAIRRWRRRCGEEAAATARPLAHRSGPKLWFAMHIERAYRGDVAWCRREGGVPLDRLEKLALRLAFRFERATDAD